MQPPDSDQLIQEVSSGTRALTADELQQVLRHVALAGFDPNAQEKARGRIAGLVWQGQIVQGSALLSPAVKHFLWHVVANGEWPAGTTLTEYVDSVRRVVLDSTSGVFTNRYHGELGLGVVRESRDPRGPRGNEWVLVQYRVSRGYWMTAFQPNLGLDELSEPGWEDIRWLQQPERGGCP